MAEQQEDVWQQRLRGHELLMDTGKNGTPERLDDTGSVNWGACLRFRLPRRPPADVDSGIAGVVDGPCRYRSMDLAKQTFWCLGGGR